MDPEEEEIAPQADNFIHLSKCLTPEELEITPASIRTKLESIFQEREDQVLVARALKRDAEVVHETETQILQKALEDKTRETESLNASITNLNGEIATLEEKLTEAKSEAAKAIQSAKTMGYEWKDFKTQRDLACDEKDSLLSMIERRNVEIAELKSEKAEILQQLKVAVEAKIVALEKAEEVDSMKVSLSYKEKRLEQEASLLKSQIDSLHDELASKNQELLNLRRSEASRQVSAESELSAKIEELRIANELIADLRETNTKLQTQSEKLLEKLKTQRELSDGMLDKFQHELTAQTRLAQLYKDMCEEDESKTKKLTDLIAELQNLLAEASAKQAELQVEYNEFKEKHDEEIARRDECIGALKAELKHANELLEATKQENREAAIADLSPYAAAASRLIKSGMTLTQIYTQYATVSEELIFVKEENRRLNLYVSTILQEIEEKAPILKQQRIDYEKAIANVENMSKQMDQMVVQMKIANDECAEAKKLSSHLTRENQRLQKELADLARQVCYLLKTLEESRDTVVSNEQWIDPAETSSAQAVISKKLVTFASIEDLQQNNQKLLALVRRLSEKHEQVEGVSAQEYQDLMAAKNRLEERIEELIEEMGRQSKMLDLIRGQSDRYQKLYEQAIGGSNHKMELNQASPKWITSTPTKKTDTPELEELNQKLEEAMKNVAKLENDKSELSRTHVEKEKTWLEKLDKLRLEINDLTSVNSKLSAQMEFGEEKVKVLDNNTKILKNQIKALEDRNRTLSDICARHEQSLIGLKDQAMENSAKLATLEVQRDRLQQENFMLKASESRLKKEVDDLSKERISHTLLQSNVDSLAAALSRSEAEGKLRLEMQLTDTVRELQQLRNVLSDEREKIKKLQQFWEEKVAQAEDKEKKESDRAELLQKERDNLVEECKKLSMEVEGLRGRLREEGNRPVVQAIQAATCNVDDSLKRIRELEDKCQSLEGEISLLKKQVDAAQGHSKQYSEMAEIAEAQLREITEEHNNCREVLSNSQKESTERERAIQNEKKELEEKLRTLSENRITSEKDYEGKVAKLNAELAAARREITSLKKDLEELRQNEIKSRDSLHIITELEKKYSQEVIMHSNDIQALDATKLELAKIRGDLDAIKRERDEIINSRVVDKEELQKLQHQNEEMAKEYETKLAALDEQNSTLHKQLQQMGEQISIVQSKISAGESSEISFNESGELSDKAQEQLLKVIKFLRQEKDILFARCEVLQAESARVKSQLVVLQKELETTKESYQSLVESADVHQKTSANQAELLRKIESLNAVTDSNRLLREERNRLKEEVSTLTKKLETAEQEGKPLLKENKELKEKIEKLTADCEHMKIDAEKWRGIFDKSKTLQAEQWRKLTNEREMLAKQFSSERSLREKTQEEVKNLKEELNTLKEKSAKQAQEDSKEIRRLTEESAALKEKLAKAGEEVATLQAQVAKLNEDLAKMTEDLSAKEASLNDIRNKEVQLKKIARKYKLGYEELTLEKKKREEEDKKREDQQQAAAQQTQQINEEEQERLRNEGRNETVEKIRDLEGRIASTSDELDQVRKDNENLKTNMSEKEERAKTAIKTARVKIGQLMEEKSKLEQELANLKQELASKQENTEFINYEEMITNLRKERDDISTELAMERERTSNQIKSLNQRVNMMQRLHDKQKPSTSSQPIQVQKSSMDPPTANIKPMAGSSTAAQHRTKPQKQQTSQAVVLTPFWTGNDTPFASIRPLPARTLAVQPQTANPGVSPNGSQTQSTPSTATATGSATGSSTGVLIAPQQVVHSSGGGSGQGDAVISSPTSSHTDYMPATSSATLIRVAVAPTPLNAQSTQDSDEPSQAEDQQQASAPSHPAPAAPTTAQPTAMVLPTTLPGPSSSASSSGSNTVTTTQAGLKRSRDSDVMEVASGGTSGMAGGSSGAGLEDGKGPMSKRSRIAPSEAFGHHHQHQVPQVSQATLMGHSEGIEVEYQVPTSSQRDQEDDIIMLDSEDDGNADEGEACEPDGDQEDFEEEDLSGYHLHASPHRFDDRDIDQPTPPDDNEVEVIEDSSEIPAAGQQTSGSVLASGGNVAAASGGEGEASSSGNGDRVVVVSHAASSQLPFRRANPPAIRQDEAVDDSIVPSTPTLFLPRRSDGFAEVVSSPGGSVGQRFTFSEPVAGTSRRDQEPVQLDDATGRSVPTTPMQVSPQEPGPEAASDPGLPHITVTLPEEEAQQEDTSSTEQPKPAADAQQPDATNNDNDSDSGVTSEGEKPPVAVVEEGREAEASETPAVITRQISTLRPRRGVMVTRRPTPIVWNEPGSSGLSMNQRPTRGGSPDFLRGGRGMRGRRNWR